MWFRGTESNCRHGDFQTKFLKIQKCCDYKQLILFQFFGLFLVSFGTVWKYLTLTGTIWAQFSFKILILKQINVLFFHPEIKFWILTIFFEKQNQISQLVSFSDFLVFWFLQNLADFPDTPRKIRTGLCSLTQPP
jgi:hypothetical protein